MVIPITICSYSGRCLYVHTFLSPKKKKKWYVDKRKKKFLKKVLSKKCHVRSHKIPRVPEIPWTAVNQDWLDYSSAFSDAFAELLCLGNEENVWFTLWVSAGDFSVCSHFYRKTLLWLRGTHLLPVSSAYPSAEKVLSHFWANHGSVSFPLVSMSIPSLLPGWERFKIC